MTGTAVLPAVSRRLIDPTFAAMLVLGSALLAVPQYPGALVPYLFFHGACALLVAAALVPPVFHGFSALTVFLLLGFWVKTVLTVLGFSVLIEPIGDFDGSGPLWDRALTMSAAGLTGIALPKLAWHFIRKGPRVELQRGVPSWYGQRRRAVWVLTASVVAAANIANWLLRFYVVGVNERLVLPMHLNVAVVWWLTFGAGMWIAVLLEFERRVGGGTLSPKWMLVPVAEAFMTTVVMLSRGFYIIKVLPYALTLTIPKIRAATRFNLRTAVVFATVGIAGFGVSLVAVTSLRLVTYPPLQLPADTTDAATSEPARGEAATERGAEEGKGVPSSGTSGVSRRERSAAAFKELARMVLGRWIGLEGMLTVSAVRDLGMDLLKTGLAEDPRASTAAVYQVMSGSTYKALEGFTFLTLPGVIAVAAYSGTPWFVLIAMAFVSSIVLATEGACRRLFENEFLCAVIGVGIANALVQMNFPYLTGVFFVELWATLAGLRLLTSIGSQRVSANTPEVHLSPL